MVQIILLEIFSHLESIFIAAEDIRKNLPEDSKRFDKNDVDFKNVLKKLYPIKNVVETTNQQGVLSELERLQKELAVCEKTSADYLETKRFAFPCFYFVSSVDLLDILSTFNGVGEFWMVKYNDDDVSEFKMQARMKQNVSPSGESMNASVFTAVVMEQVRNGERVKVQVFITQRKRFLSCWINTLLTLIMKTGRLQYATRVPA